MSPAPAAIPRLVPTMVARTSITPFVGRHVCGSRYPGRLLGLLARRGGHPDSTGKRSRYGGAAPSITSELDIAIAAAPGDVHQSTQFVDLVLHEIGHSFGSLHDELDGTCDEPFDSWRRDSREPPYPNITLESTRDSIKWSDWIHPVLPFLNRYAERGGECV